MIAKRCPSNTILIRNVINLIEAKNTSISSISLSSKLFSNKKYFKIKLSKKSESTKSLNWLIKPFREKDQQQQYQNQIENGRFYHEKIVLGYSRQQMCDLVFNVEKYKEFVPFCVHSEILEKKKDKDRFNLNSPKNRNQLKLINSQQKVLNSLKKKHELELPQTFDARLEIGYPPIKESYISHVSMIRPHMVKAVSSETRLFEYLINEWKFHKYDNCSHPNKSNTASNNADTPTNIEEENCCIVEFYVSFKFHSIMYTEVTNLFMDQIFKKMVGAFTSRARQLYGPASMEPTTLQKS